MTTTLTELKTWRMGMSNSQCVKHLFIIETTSLFSTTEVYPMHLTTHLPDMLALQQR